jgi:mannose-6-phosphate isomerase-like protein (cupin superfamily)
MVAEALEREIRSYSIGEKLRSLRLGRKMGLVELGKHTGLSPALISKIERDKLFPTLPTLVRISMVFGVGLEHFFGDEQRRPLSVTRSDERMQFPESPDRERVAYTFQCLDYKSVDRKTNSYLAEFKPLSETETVAHQHEGAEFIFVMEGDLELSVKGDSVVLSAGDSIYFDATTPHSYRAVSNGSCRAIVVTSA